MERVSGEGFHERESMGAIPIDRSTHSASQQLASCIEDKHNWQERSDERIKLAVMTALHWDLAVPRDRVQVSVDCGRVTLTGRMTREYEKSRAEADALMVPRVAGVTNGIVLDGD